MTLVIFIGQTSMVEFRALQKELATKSVQRDESLLLIKVRSKVRSHRKACSLHMLDQKLEVIGKLAPYKG